MRNVVSVVVVSALIASGASAATFTVTNTNDAGAGSLRQAITDANASVTSTGVPATVKFSIGSGVKTIAPLSVLSVGRDVTIDGSTQPGYAGTPVIELDDSLVPVTATSACLQSSGTIRALVVNRCRGRGIEMRTGRVTSCFIGTDVTGHSALANNTGVFIGSAGIPDVSQLGGATAAQGNLISGNEQDVTVAAAGAEVSHNLIGTDAAGGVPPTIPYKDNAAISVEYTSNVSIHDNVIAHRNTAIACLYSDGTQINWNYIGINASGTYLGILTGIRVYQSNFTAIGTNGPNVIAYAYGSGISVEGSSIRNTIRHNSIYHSGIGIDLQKLGDINGVTPNDVGDGDSGPNLLQNYPVLTNVTSLGGQTTITGTINSTANQAISLDFYSGQCTVGASEGETPIGSTSVQTDGSGNASFTVTLPATVAPGSVVTATATDPYGNTSEFSACRTVQGAGSFVFASSQVFVGEGAGTVSLTVNRINGTVGAVTVRYATTDGNALLYPSAMAGSDYTATSGTLSFANGEFSKSFTVPITNDTVFEHDETFSATLSAPTNGASLGSQSSVMVIIAENDPQPQVSIADASLLEGNSGTSNMTFTLTLTGATTLPATVAYSTYSRSALAGEDFQTVSESVRFNVGETQKTINVPIIGDTAVEPDETFLVALAKTDYATVNRSPATGRIINDDTRDTVVSANDVTISEGNSGTTSAVITLAASQPFSGEVDFFTVDGTARSGSDYTPRTSFVIFNNDSTKTIEIPIIGDTLAELAETFSVHLSLVNGPATVTLANSVVSLTILDDDPATAWSLTPSFGATSGNTLVKIAGSNIAAGCWPFFDGIPARSAIVNGPSEMIAATPAHASATTVPFVLRCAGASDVSLPNAFTYSGGAESSPIIIAVDPLSGPSGKSVTISGAGFRFADTVTFDAVRATILSTSPGTHVVRIPDLPLGKTSITVTDLAGHASTTGPIFTILDPPLPQITSITPPSSRPSNEVTIDGNGFRPGYTFTIGDQPAAIVTLAYTRVVLRVPQLAPGSYAVNILNAASNVAVTGPQFTILAGGLAVIRVAPACVTTSGGGQVTINGTGFVTGAVVTFDGAIASGAVVADAQTITLTLPPLAAGAPRIVVTNPNGDSASLTNVLNVTSPFDPNGCAPRSRPARH